MNEQASITKDDLHDWIDIETRSLDLIASWENLCTTYDTLRFTDPIDDVTRIDEFRWIIHRMNVFFAKIRKKLLSCSSIDATIEVLYENISPQGQTELKSRQALAFQKLRQQWIMSTINKLTLQNMERMNDSE